MLRSNAIQSSEKYFDELRRVIDRLPYRLVEEMADTILHTRDQGQTIYFFGNGGSAALASHMACDLGKGTIVPGNTEKRIRALALTDNTAVMTAWANDVHYEDIFAEQLRNFVAPGDVAFAISASGNSPNVLKALRLARDSGAFTIGLTGYQGGQMKALCDLCLVVPADNMQLIEDLHLSVAHALFTVVRSRITAGAAQTAGVGGS